MQFQRLGEAGHEIPVVIHDGVTKDLRPLTSDITPAFIASTTAADVALRVDELPELAGAHTMRVGPPLSRPGAIYCVGQNYAKHAAESGSAPPEHVVIFLKPPHTLAGPHDDLILYPGFTSVDWEVELAIVVGATAWQLSAADNPLDYIFGFAVANDVSDRYWQKDVSGGQWSKGKSGPGFLPFGPAIVPASEVTPGSLQLKSWVNGDPRQDSHTEDMIFSVEQIMRDISQFTVLEPGDIILTGTPEGVALSGRYPYLADGDTVTVSIDGLGQQTQNVYRQQ